MIEKKPRGPYEPKWPISREAALRKVEPKRKPHERFQIYKQFLRDRIRYHERTRRAVETGEPMEQISDAELQKHLATKQREFDRFNFLNVFAPAYREWRPSYTQAAYRARASKGGAAKAEKLKKSLERTSARKKPAQVRRKLP